MGKGLCAKHYMRKWNTGVLTLVNCNHFSMSRPEELINFLLEHRHITNPHKVLKTPCWEFTKGRVRDGYGEQQVDKRKRSVHRISKALFDGFDINSQLHILHKCDNPSCFNPTHLYIGTHQDNMRDRANRGRGYRGVGENNGRAKLNEHNVREILRLKKLGTSFSEIARTFSVSVPTVVCVCNRETWNHVK